ncbi:hypothetical protein ACJJTC_000789 [Scirpophaga incertulas]
MTDYERIKSSCVQRGELWEDPDFPVTECSLFYYQRPPFQFTWKRPKEMYSTPSFVLPEYNFFDIVPGILGDRWLAYCLGALYLSKGLFYRVVPADQHIDSSYAGIFKFRLWWCGQWLEVLVDDRLPTVNGKLVFLQSSQSEQMWPALLEKAYAKLHGSYEALKYGCLLDGLADLTGGITESIRLTDITDPNSLSAMLKTTSIVTAYRYPYDKEMALDKIRGLDVDMTYRIYSVEKTETQDGEIYLVQLRRPLRPGDSPVRNLLPRSLLNSLPEYMQERLSLSPKNFWMLYSDFQRKFYSLKMVHLDIETSRTEASLVDKHKWHMNIHQGGWRRGVSAGGCRNNIDFFHMNPQIQLVIKEPDFVVISLNQHSIMEPKVIGFSMYKIPEPLTETAPAYLFKRIRSIINSQYSNSRQVSHRCHLEAGTYLVMPTTFEPRTEADFTLRVFSIKSINMNVLDNNPQMLRAALLKAPSGTETTSFQYEPLFLHLANEHRTIDAFGLQELLEACLPNDYIKSCASIDTCRQIVLSMDTKGTGRISLTDFKDLMCSLKYWQLIFKDHAREKMGVLCAERLGDALKEVGFIVPERTMALLVLRYMKKDGMLRFGDFVSAVMHLHRAFHTFYMTEAPPSSDTNVHSTLSQWLRCALTF